MNRIKNIVSYILLTLLLITIVTVTPLFFLFDDITKYFIGGNLKLIILFVYIAAIILPIIIIRKSNKRMNISAVIILSLLCAVIANAMIYGSSKLYISRFSAPNWEKYKELRLYMVEDFENRYKPLGNDEQYIIQFLGNPSVINDRDNSKQYQYYICEGYIDPITYDIIFTDGIATYSTITEH